MENISSKQKTPRLTKGEGVVNKEMKSFGQRNLMTVKIDVAMQSVLSLHELDL